MLFVFTFILVAVLESSHPDKSENCKTKTVEKTDQLKDTNIEK